MELLLGQELGGAPDHLETTTVGIQYQECWQSRYALAIEGLAATLNVK